MSENESWVVSKLVDAYAKSLSRSDSEADTCLDRIIAGGNLQERHDISGDGLLHYAAVYHRYEHIERLLRAGADVHQRNAYLQLPLHGAARFGYTQNVLILLEAGSDLSAVDAHGLTPIMWARQSEQMDVVAAIEAFECRQSIGQIASSARRAVRNGAQRS